MPIYEYRCERGHTFEALQRMTDDPLTSCSTCAAPVERVFHPVAVHFKGSGFYNTDYGKSKGASDTTSGSSEAGESKPQGEAEKKPSGDSGAAAKKSSAGDD